MREQHLQDEQDGHQTQKQKYVRQDGRQGADLWVLRSICPEEKVDVLTYHREEVDEN